MNEIPWLSDFHEPAFANFDEMVELVMLPVGRPDDVDDCPLLELFESSKRAFEVM